MKIRSWTTTIDNTIYNIKYSKTLLKKELIVNNTAIKLQNSKTLGITRETIFSLGDTTAILVNIDNECDVAINGKYLNSGEVYVEVKSMPQWNLIFSALILLIFIFSYDSICSALFTILGIYFLIRASIEPSLNSKKRIIICTVITVLMHLFFWCVLSPLISIL